MPPGKGLQRVIPVRGLPPGRLAGPIMSSPLGPVWRKSVRQSSPGADEGSPEPLAEPCTLRAGTRGLVQTGLDLKLQRGPRDQGQASSSLILPPPATLLLWALTRFLQGH